MGAAPAALEWHRAAQAESKHHSGTAAPFCAGEDIAEALGRAEDVAPT